MYYSPKEHNPPHIHVYYQNSAVVINIENCKISRGILPAKQKRLVIAWIEIHKEESLQIGNYVRMEKNHLRFNLYNNMNSYFAIIDVKTVEDFKLLLTFSNGEKRMFDTKPYLNKGIFKELQDVALFKTAHISFDTVEWDNEANFDPEMLYEESKRIKEKKYSKTNALPSSVAEPRSKFKKKKFH